MPEITTTAQLIKLVKAHFGFPTVKFELPDETLSQFVEEAMLKLSSYIDFRKFFTRDYSPVIDLTEENILDVVHIYRQPGSATGAGSGEDLDLFRAFNIAFGGYIDVSVLQLYQAKVSLFTSVIADGWKFVDNKLYLYNYSGPITIEALGIPTVETLTQPKWRSWALNYVRACTKIALGNVRGKFQISNLPVTVNGQDLVSQGEQEKLDLENQLVGRGEGLFYVTTS